MNLSPDLSYESSTNSMEGPSNAKKPRMSTISRNEDFLQAEIQRLKSELAKSVEIVKKKDQVIVKQVMDIDKMEDENTIKDKEISTSKRNEAELRSTIEDLEETIRMHGDNTNDEMDNEKIKEMEEQLKKKNEQLKTLEEKNAQMEKTINNLIEKNSDLNQKEESAQQNVEEHEKKIKDLEAQILNAKNIENQLRARISELKSVENNFAEVTINFNDLAKKNSEMKKQVENMRKLMSDKDKQIKNLKEQIPNSSEELTVKHVSLNEIFDGNEIIWDDRVSLTILNVKKVQYNNVNGWSIHSDDGTVLPLDTLKKYDANFKLNLTRDFICSDADCGSMKSLSEIVCSTPLKNLRFYECETRHEEFFQLLKSHTITDFCFVKSTIEREEKPVSINEILKELPNIQKFRCINNDSEIAIFKETLINLAKLPPFSELRNFELEIEIEEFNIEAFSKFIKKHRDVEFVFRFDNAEESFIDEWKKEAKKAIDELKKNYKLSVKFMPYLAKKI